MSLIDIAKQSLLNNENPDINLLKYFNEYLTIKEREHISKTINLDIIKKNKNIRWSLKSIKNRDDLKMTDIKELSYIGNFSSQYFRLTFYESTKICTSSSIMSNLNLKWHPMALSKIEIECYCSDCLIIFLKTFQDLNFPIYKKRKITKKLSIKIIMENINLPYWDKKILSAKIIENGICFLPEDNTIQYILYKNPDLLDLEKLINYIDCDIICKIPYLNWNLRDKVLDISKLPKIYQIRIFIENKIPVNINTVFQYLDINDLYLLEDKIKLLDFEYYFLYTVEERFLNIMKFKIPEIKIKNDMSRETKEVSWSYICNYPFYNWDYKVIEEKSLNQKKIIPVCLLKYFNKKIKFNYQKLSEFISFGDILNTPYLSWDYQIISKRQNIPFIFFKIFIINNIPLVNMFNLKNIVTDEEIFVEIEHYLRKHILVLDINVIIMEYIM